MSDLADMQALLGYWGQANHQDILTLAPKRLAGRLQSSGGLKAWLGLRWYPILLLYYSGGIGAVAAGRYDNLKSLFLAPAPEIDDYQARSSLMVALRSGPSDLSTPFKTLPGHERQFTPQSEYLDKYLLPQLDDLLFLGSDYEQYFDRFEILLSLSYLYVCAFAWGSGRRRKQGLRQYRRRLVRLSTLFCRCRCVSAYNTNSMAHFLVGLHGNTEVANRLVLYQGSLKKQTNRAISGHQFRPAFLGDLIRNFPKLPTH